MNLSEVQDQNQRAWFGLQRHLLEECQAMVHYGLSHGIKVPPPLVQSLQDTTRALSGPGAQPPAGQAAEGSPVAPLAPLEETARWAERLTTIHERLADLVAPARPGTLLLLQREAARPGWARLLGPVPLVRQMMTASIISVVGLLLIASSELVNGDPKNFSLFANSGWSLVFNEAFLLCAAGIGASFAALFRASRFINDRSFDETYDSVYWVRFMLGLTAGTILALLINIDTFPKPGEPASDVLHGFGKSVLALLGGFSADFVYRVLTRFISAAESFFAGDTRDLLANQERAARLRFVGQEMQVRMRLSKRLNDVQCQLEKHTDPKALRDQLSALQAELVNGGNGEAKGTPVTSALDEVPGSSEPTAFFRKR